MSKVIVALNGLESTEWRRRAACCLKEDSALMEFFCREFKRPIRSGGASTEELRKIECLGALVSARD